MPLPHNLEPNTVAKSGDVMANFLYLQSLIGTLSGPGRIVGLTEFQMGGRNNVLFTGSFDTGPADREFFQIGWNVDYNLVGGQWKMARFLSNEAAGAIRIGPAHFSVWMTSSPTGDLNTLMNPVFKIQANPADPNTDFIYVRRDWSFQIHDGVARNLGDYRLTYVPRYPPSPILNLARSNDSRTVRNAQDYGVPSYAKAISITCEVSALASTSTRIRFFQNRTGANFYDGFTCAAPKGQHGAAWGIVPLGTGGHQGEFVVESTAGASAVSAAITGYWL